MLIATFGPTTAWLGKTIVFDDRRFVLQDHGPVTAQDVLDYESQGHLVWSSSGAREFVEMKARGYARFAGDLDLIERAQAAWSRALMAEMWHRNAVGAEFMRHSRRGSLPSEREVERIRRRLDPALDRVAEAVAAAQVATREVALAFGEHGMNLDSARSLHSPFDRILEECADLAGVASQEELETLLHQRQFGSRAG
jgi:hypothetical protein